MVHREECPNCGHSFNKSKSPSNQELTFHYATGLVCYSGRMVKISPSSLTVLECLMDSRGRGVSAEEIWSALYGDRAAEDQPQGLSIISVYLHHLRAKMKELGIQVSCGRGTNRYALIMPTYEVA